MRRQLTVGRASLRTLTRLADGFGGEESPYRTRRIAWLPDSPLANGHTGIILPVSSVRFIWFPRSRQTAGFSE
ncbi:hypothetical protein LQV63_12685 [Paenibacillus profundus]|uniref:Uncharacterized protein n=1 Tax=Paenibacillus profundus TaxID=1173085 RepID=A0ABS8YIZ4_9BACL|nr:hypothetical protein [Paenibacillus profundus]